AGSGSLPCPVRRSRWLGSGASRRRCGGPRRPSGAAFLLIGCCGRGGRGLLHHVVARAARLLGGFGAGCQSSTDGPCHGVALVPRVDDGGRGTAGVRGGFGTGGTVAVFLVGGLGGALLAADAFLGTGGAVAAPTAAVTTGA